MAYLAKDPKVLGQGAQVPQVGIASAPQTLGPPPEGPLTQAAQGAALELGADVALNKAFGMAPTTKIGSHLLTPAAEGVKAGFLEGALASAPTAAGTTAAGTAATTGLASAAPLFGPAAVGYVGYRAIRGGK